MAHLQAAFDAICTEQRTPETWYVCLIESYQAYGGPEEGGWWYTRSSLVAYQAFASRELAEAAAESVEKLAAELDEQAQWQYGEMCLSQCEWLEARGLDPDYLPENDGPDEYRVMVTEELPQFDHSRPHYC